MIDERAVFAAETDNVGAARAFVAMHLGAMGCRSGVVDLAQLLVSELATNVLASSSREFAVVVHGEPGRVTVEVSGQDSAALADVEATRHLRVVDEVADEWRVRDDDDGSCSVAFDLTC
jgi:hypothetical protein